MTAVALDLATDRLLSGLARLGDDWDVRHHPFHRRWSRGGLSAAALACYASEFHHAMLAIARASRRAAELADDDALAATLRVRAATALDEHDMWLAFARSAGWGAHNGWYFGEDPYPETEACAQAWAGGRERPLAEHLATLHAIDAMRARAGAGELAALLEHHRFDVGPTTEYFRLQARRGGGDQALATAAAERADAATLLACAEAALRAHWHLLDALPES